MTNDNGMSEIMGYSASCFGALGLFLAMYYQFIEKDLLQANNFILLSLLCLNSSYILLNKRHDHH